MAQRLRPSPHASRILVVEDSEDVRALMQIVLEAEGYLVDTAVTAEEGLRLLASGREYALVLSDYALPGRTGAWLLREAMARRLLSGIAGIIVTAHPNPSEAAGLPIITKPLDFDQFIEHIRSVAPPDANRRH